MDPSRGVIIWSAQRARQHLQTVVATAIAIPLAATIAGLFIALPPHPSRADLIVGAAEALGVGLLIVLLLAFIYAILLAPYEQRKALRNQVNSLREEYEQKRRAVVWPHVDPSQSTMQMPGGQTRRRHEWYLVLRNTGDAPARDVRVRTETSNAAGSGWPILGSGPQSEPEVEILAPHSEIRFALPLAIGDPNQVSCVVSWTDDLGNHENRATLRIT